MDRLHNSKMSPYEKLECLDSIKSQVESAWRTDEIRRQKPTPQASRTPVWPHSVTTAPTAPKAHGSLHIVGVVMAKAAPVPTECCVVRTLFINARTIRVENSFPLCRER